MRRLLAPVLNRDDTYNLPKLGRIVQRKRRHLWLTSREEAIWRCLAENGGARCLHAAAIAYEKHEEQKIRQNGGRIETTTTYHGETTTTVREYSTPKAARTGRVRSTPRAARPRERRASASSSTSSQDPGDPLPPAPVVPALAPRGAAERVVAGWLAVGAMVVAREAKR